MNKPTADALDEDDLCTLAETRKSEGDRRLQTFMLGRRDYLPQLLERVEKAEATPKRTKRKSLSRMRIVEKTASDTQCSCPVSGQWLKATDEFFFLFSLELTAM